MAVPEIPVVHPSAEFTHAAVEAFESDVATHLQSSVAGLVVDLSGVSLITSAGLSCLVHVGQRLHERGGWLVLAGGSRPVVKLIRLVGLNDVLPHFPSAREAAIWVEKKAR